MRTDIFLRCAMLSLLFPSCAFYATGWKSSNPPGQAQASFNTFRGKHTTSIEATKGDRLVIAYAINITGGSLLLSINKSGHRLWQKSVSGQGDTTEFQLPADKSGMYKITIQGIDAAGSFDLHYKTVTPKKVQVKMNKNIELFGLMMQLDLGPDLLHSVDTVLLDGRRATWRDWYALAFKNYLRYKGFDSCRMMQTYRTLTGKGFYNDFFIGLLLQVDEVPFAKINAATDNETIVPFSERGLEDAKKQATAFLDLFNRFYNEVDFGKYLDENRKYYEQAKADVERNLPDGFFLPALENFYGKGFSAYCFVPSLNIPTSMGFGKMHKTAQTIYNTFGPFSFQSLDGTQPDVGFNYRDRIQGLSVHEFGHSFVNPAIDKVPKALIDSTEYLFTPIKAEMSKKAYPSWKICLYEHFVRAGEVVIARKSGNTAGAEKKLQDDVAANFIYLPLIVKELEAYDRNKSSYKSYDDFVPLVIEKLAATTLK